MCKWYSRGAGNRAEHTSILVGVTATEGAFLRGMKAQDAVVMRVQQWHLVIAVAGCMHFRSPTRMGIEPCFADVAL